MRQSGLGQSKAVCKKQTELWPPEKKGDRTSAGLTLSHPLPWPSKESSFASSRIRSGPAPRRRTGSRFPLAYAKETKLLAVKGLRRQALGSHTGSTDGHGPLMLSSPVRPLHTDHSDLRNYGSV